jgi:Dyp-type peroxidase family
MASEAGFKLELDDIQSGALRPRPTPYVGTYILLRIDHEEDGRELMRRASAFVASAAHPESPVSNTWVSLSLSFQGLKALGVPQDSLDSFPVEFQQGMAARAKVLGDTGENSPENWEKPLGTPGVHVVITAISPDQLHLASALERARQAYKQLRGITAIWRQNVHVMPGEKEPFGFRDGISHPAIEGSGIPGTNPNEQSIKAGDFILGYPDEMGAQTTSVRPEILGRNGSYVAFRKLHQRVAEFRKYLKSISSCGEEEELIAAKMMGRWRSGAPLARCPLHDDPALGADPKRNNDFLYKQDDSIGYKTPPGSHIRRMNPRDSDVAGVVRLHRMIRRGTAYGPPLPDGVLKDDGQDRGLMFAFIGAHLGRQFEFVQQQWLQDAEFFGDGDTKDPIAGTAGGTGMFDIPQRPLRRRLKGLPQFVIMRGGEYCFMPGRRALGWLAALGRTD